MPTFRYICRNCGHEVEIFHPMSENRTTCSKCKKETLERQIGPGAGVIFKGEGFHSTDYNVREGGQ